MRAYTVKEIADIVGGELIAGDGGRQITEFSTSSKEGDAATMFVPVIGERADAHDFIGDAYAHGMRATFTCRGRQTENGRDGVGPAGGAAVAGGAAEKKAPRVLKPDAENEREAGQEAMAYVYINEPGEKNPNVAALQRFGAHVRGTFSLPVVGITGSVGKTTTKEMVAAALQTGLCTLKTAGNMNSQIGVPRMMCRLGAEHEIAVIEMGMSMPGEMERLVRVARPESAVMTNIGVSHIGQLGSKENIRREKLNIINAFPDGGVLFLNGDDPMLAQAADAWRAVREEAAGQPAHGMPQEKAAGAGVRQGAEPVPEAGAAAETGETFITQSGTVTVHGVELDAPTAERFRHIRIVTCGTGEDCDYRAKNIRTEGEETHFTLCTGGKTPEQPEKRLSVRLCVLGQHNVLNALTAFAVAEHYGIAPEQAAEGLYGYHPIAMRGGHIEANGMTLIDDTYNASPDSMRGGIDSLMATRAKRHIAVLADMLELGAISKECHEQVGRYAAERGVDYIVAVGREARYYISASTGVESRLFADNGEALAFLERFVQPGDAVLFKGSRGMQLEQLVAGLSGKTPRREA